MDTKPLEQSGETIATDTYLAVIWSVPDSTTSDRSLVAAKYPNEPTKAIELAQTLVARRAVKRRLIVPRRGRPSGQKARIEAIVAAVRAGHETRLAAAQALDRATGFGEEHGGFKADVRAAGGWQKIRRRAGKP